MRIEMMSRHTLQIEDWVGRTYLQRVGERSVLVLTRHSHLRAATVLIRRQVS